MSPKASSPIPALQRAIIQDPEGKLTIVDNAPVPVLRPGTMLVKTVAVSLNHIDYKICDASPSPGAVAGMELVGRVIKQESSRNGEDPSFAVGDMVCGTIHGSNAADPTAGCFAEYVRVPADLMFRVPNSLPPEKAATIGMPLLTNVLALWDSLGITALPQSPISQPAPVLVYGGSTACGTMAIQLLKILGYDPVAVCSPRNFDMVISFGASAVFDYKSASVARDIKTYTGGRLRHALDCISDQASASCCYASLGRPGGRYAHLEGIPKEWKTRDAVKPDFVMALEGFGAEVKMRGDYGRPASPEKRALALKLYRELQKLLDQDKIKPHPTRVVGAGFENILEGLQQLQSGSVSGEKLAIWIDQS